VIIEDRYKTTLGEAMKEKITFKKVIV